MALEYVDLDVLRRESVPHRTALALARLYRRLNGNRCRRARAVFAKIEGVKSKVC
jgi:hypothetical protein